MYSIYPTGGENRPMVFAGIIFSYYPKMLLKNNCNREKKNNKKDIL